MMRFPFLYKMHKLITIVFVKVDFLYVLKVQYWVVRAIIFSYWTMVQMVYLLMMAKRYMSASISIETIVYQINFLEKKGVE